MYSYITTLTSIVTVSSRSCVNWAKYHMFYFILVTRLGMNVSEMHICDRFYWWLNMHNPHLRPNLSTTHAWTKLAMHQHRNSMNTARQLGCPCLQDITKSLTYRCWNYKKNVLFPQGDGKWKELKWRLKGGGEGEWWRWTRERGYNMRAIERGWDWERIRDRFIMLSTHAHLGKIKLRVMWERHTGYRENCYMPISYNGQILLTQSAMIGMNVGVFASQTRRMMGIAIPIKRHTLWQKLK